MYTTRKAQEVNHHRSTERSVGDAALQKLPERACTILLKEECSFS